jgi:peptidoglycan-N-acetylglucosamine deacetylase
MKSEPYILSRFMNISFIFASLLQLTACKNDTIPTTNTPQYQPSNDSLLAEAEKKDTVAAIPAKISKAIIDSNTKVVYLTFDDGPLSPTNFLTDIISKKQVKMSAFVVGKHAQSNKNFMQKMEDMRVNPYIELCNHSYSHAYHKYKQFYSSPLTAAKDMMDNEKDLNLNLKIIRMPGRDIWATPNIQRGWSQSGGKTASILLDNGFKIYGWDIEWEHYANTLPKETPQQFIARVDDLFKRKAMQVPNHLVILGHDEMLVKERGREDLVRIIDMLKERGYTFEFISNYPQ